MQLLLPCISIATVLLLTSSYSRSGAYDLWIVELILSLGICAVAFPVLGRYQPDLFNASNNGKGRYGQIPLDDFRDATPSRPKEHTSSAKRSGISRQLALIAIAITALVVRIELYRLVEATVQCSVRSYAVFLPLCLAINECRYQQRMRVETAEDDVDSTVYDALMQNTKSYLLQPRWRYVPPALTLSFGCYGITALWRAQHSTYICSQAFGESTLIPRLQFLALVLDTLLCALIQEVSRRGSCGQPRLLSLPAFLATVLFGAASAWSAYAVVLRIAHIVQPSWLLKYDNPSVNVVMWHVLSHTVLLCTCAVATVYCIVHYGAYQTSTLLVTSATAFTGISGLWSVRRPFPPITSHASILPFLILYLGAWSSYRIAQAVGQISTPRSRSWQVLLLVIFLPLVFLGFWKYDSVYFHPIELLMFEAKNQHEEYVGYAAASTDLKSAVDIYRARYGNSPPPGFDVWYEYARNRSALIIDDYDQIDRDLAPFVSVLPATLREQTSYMVSNQWNGVSGIKIRSGKAEVHENVVPTHRWMLDGVATLINSFAHHLPDMDLAFNINDEPRVAVPYDGLASLRDAGSRVKLNGTSTWSSDRTSTWPPFEPVEGSIFKERSFWRSFRGYGIAGCPPNSLAITQPYLSSQSHLCIKCLGPHSLGQFVSNWTLAADACHQPDLSVMHGFYLSPAAFKVTHELVPVFSQSKASGYNDILYPSSWNYMDKVVYAPTPEKTSEHPDLPFTDKQNLLFWRGATSEGVSGESGLWRGMTRQRAVHLANNATSNSDHDRTTILLPDPLSQAKYQYYSLPGSALTHLGLQQSTDIRVVDNIVRCGGRDCTDQMAEFGVTNPIDFQEHWRYKFLLDMDGAGFSGRFLPFLRSRSLPFKTALFREWYDSRITAWRHFVPIDIRLHGVWSTLAYFAGVDGTWPGSGGKRYKWEAHTSQGEIIAEEGRNWANQVLRKEDMEVYFFRLLLEWGRLTDDNRDRLGFTMH